MGDKDYINYDYLEIIVKQENKQEIIDGYSTFLWQLIDAKQDRRYSDLADITFRRDINVPNKDRLSLLQVYYETALNKSAELKLYKHSKSKTAILKVAVLSLAVVFGVGVFIYFLKNVLTIALGGALALCTLTLDLFIVSKIKKLIIKENKDCAMNLEMIEEEIKGILQNARALTKEGRLEIKGDK